MDYFANRQKYLKVYPAFLEKLVLDDYLVSKVKEYNPTLWESKQNPSDAAIKSYILLELTKSRESCAKVIKYLSKSKEIVNLQLAAILIEGNTSPGRRDYGYDSYISVTPVLRTKVRLPDTRHYSMTRDRRGRAIIFNLVPEEIIREGNRFYHIFEQLYFEVQMHINLTTTQIKHELEIISNEMIEKENNGEEADEALIVMVITHGGDQIICGGDHPACSKIWPNDPKFEEAVQDFTPISDIVNIFSNVNDLGIAKIFFFICCRDIDDYYISQMNEKCSSKDEVDTTTDAFVYYSCALGYETPIHGTSFYTPYGKALSESIAQYAHSEDMVKIMNRTYEELKKYVRDASPVPKGQHYSSHDYKGVRGKLYFNPGWHEQEEC